MGRMTGGGRGQERDRLGRESGSGTDGGELSGPASTTASEPSERRKRDGRVAERGPLADEFCNIAASGRSTGR
jgi:hypothetical protein